MHAKQKIQVNLGRISTVRRIPKLDFSCVCSIFKVYISVCGIYYETDECSSGNLFAG